VPLSQPAFNWTNPALPVQGFELTYSGVAPSPSNPFQCPVNPVTGQPNNPMVTYVFACDASVDGAQLLSVQQVPTNPCAYRLHFVTNLLCFD
jgi:hypothetical protein